MTITVDAYQLGYLLGRLQGQADKAANLVETSSHALTAGASKQLADVQGGGLILIDYDARASYFEGYGAGYSSATK